MNHFLGRTLAVAAAIGALALVSVPANADGSASFGFESLGPGALGMGVPILNVLPDVGTGITASFTSPNLIESVDAPFTLQDNVVGDFSNFTGLYLQENPGGLGGAPLLIEFSQKVSFLSLNFALLDEGHINFLTDTGMGGTVDGSPVDGFDFFEGTMAIEGLFQSIQLWGASGIGTTQLGDNYLNIDNFRLTFVGAQDVPEPGALALALAIAVPVTLSFKRRRK